jgi:hypothetical protein
MTQVSTPPQQRAFLPESQGVVRCVSVEMVHHWTKNRARSSTGIGIPLKLSEELSEVGFAQAY